MNKDLERLEIEHRMETDYLKGLSKKKRSSEDPYKIKFYDRVMELILKEKEKFNEDLKCFRIEKCWDRSKVKYLNNDLNIDNDETVIKLISSTISKVKEDAKRLNDFMESLCGAGDYYTDGDYYQNQFLDRIDKAIKTGDYRIYNMKNLEEFEQRLIDHFFSKDEIVISFIESVDGVINGEEVTHFIILLIDYKNKECNYKNSYVPKEEFY